MGSSLIKDLHIFDKDLREHVHIRWPDWVKREPPYELIQSYLEQIAQHVEAIEVHLEGTQAGGKAFVRPQERPAVGNEALGADAVRGLEQRIEKIERSLKGK